jgi:mannose-6-phosphate isomerase-like protein (cupin superfamily)
MERQGKVWGSTSPLLCKNNVEVHRIGGNSGGFCSKHMHNNKFNMFYVESGRLKIEVWKKDYDLIDVTYVDRGDICTVSPGEYHRFTILDNNTVAFEFYWTEIDASDIIREDHGGIDEQSHY